jgi:oxygen-independent coproporphyrinogen III oxidase
MSQLRVATTVGLLPLDSREASMPVPAGVYVHFPFCRHICTYCDFDAFSGMERLIEGYMEAAVQQARSSPGARAVSLYVGGGTPSLMEPRHAEQLVGACRERFGLAEDAETTIEANPSGLTLDTLVGFRRAGFNRISVGVQSTDSPLLRLLGRRHTSLDAEETVRTARSAGFGNVSVDLIYGVPRQTRQSWMETIEAAVEWGVDHISCYMLTVEDETPLARGVSRGTIVVPGDEDVASMYEDAIRTLGEAGYQRYEISNWARPGFESDHNLIYWRNQPYLAIGAGAAGYWAGRRYKLLPDVARYVAGVRAGSVPLCEDEAVDRRRAMSETLMLGLRLMEGVSCEGFRLRHGVDPVDAFPDALGWAEAEGMLRREAGRLLLTEKGILLSNELFERLL